MDLLPHEMNLQQLIAKGKEQGYLTYDEVNQYLPDEDINPEKLDDLIIALDEQGIELVEEPPAKFDEGPTPLGPSARELQELQEEVALIAAEDLPKLSDDPILRYRPSAYSVSIERRSRPH